jgi:2-polyprenyl-3-methyl-5-hydroxy-6-metoxy-1,4-benzoquinol methylase
VSASNYTGTELDLFSHAQNWKQYWSRQVAPFVYGSVLDVGAGLGATIETLSKKVDCQWTALEPDSVLTARILEARDRGQLPASTQVINGVLADLQADALFDTILYVDVLEHIEDDRSELEAAACRLSPGGHLIVLAPAHQMLYTPFDAAIGHFRRYNRKSLCAIVPASTEIVKLRYLDGIGMLASAGNRWLLRSAMPTPQQISVWDRLLVPMSIPFDRITLGLLGKSICLVCRRKQ